jgi:two-component system OmpR family sensor kinase
VRSFILPVYRSSANKLQLIGYIRANESTIALDSELGRLRWGLGLGGLVVVGLTALGGIWLTHESLKPIILSFDRLRQFTADASHELRNPLTAIRASIAVMQSHPERVHPADVEKLAAIASASEQMSQLVNDLLLLARMDRQAPDRKQWRAIAIDEILEDSIELFTDPAEQAGIALKSQLIADVIITGDAGQLQRLITNLLANALQYTPSGGVVTVSLAQFSDRAVISFEDTGIGIAAEHLPHIFERFWRADLARSQHAGGTGLGLAIARAITQQHGGEILVRSQLGIGSCFQVQLPLPHHW